MEDAARLLQLVVNGAAAGCIYGLIALGFVLIYKATEMVNFAQGDIMMLGGFVAYSAITHFGLNYWLGGLIAIAVTAAFGYALDFVSFLVSAALIGSVAIVRAVSPARAATAEESTNSKVHAIFHEMGEGMWFIVHHAAVSFVVMAMAAGMFVMGCFGPLIAIYVRDWLHARAGTFGLVSAMVGTGMMLGMPVVRRLSGQVANTTLVLGGLSGIGLGALLLGAFTFIPTAMLGCFTLGFTFAGVIVPAQTLIQQETPPALIGRISSTMMSVVVFAQVVGLVLSGFLAQALGVRAVFFLCAVLAWVLTVAGKLLLGTERHAAAQ